MRNHYLELLELQPGASEEEIKKAYRKLSKKYHPDLKRETSSRDKFIEITEAYDFLLDVGPKPHDEEISYDYDPYSAEYEARRKWARERAEKQAREKEHNSRRVDKFLIVSNWIFLLILSAFAADIILPSRSMEAEVIRSGPHLEYHAGGEYSRGKWIASAERFVLYTTKGNILLSRKKNGELKRGEKGTLKKSIFYSIKTSFIQRSTGIVYRVSNPIFGYLVFFPLSAFVSCIVALRAKKRPVLWNFGSAGFVLVPIFFYIIAWYS